MVKTSYTVTRFDVGYQGFYVEVTPYMQDGEEWLEFTLSKEECDIERLMFKVKAIVTEDEWEGLIMGKLLTGGYIADFYDDMAEFAEPEDDKDECKFCDKYDFIMEAIDYHNEHVEDMQDLAEALLKQYPDIEKTEVNDVFCQAFNSKDATAILLCCEANSLFDDGDYMVTDDGYVVERDECECNGDCENCPMDK